MRNVSLAWVCVHSRWLDITALPLLLRSGQWQNRNRGEPPLPRPRLGLACILVYRSLPQVVARKRPPPPPNFHHPICVTDLVSRDQVSSQVSIRHLSALWTPRLSIYDDSDGVQVLAHAAACSQRFDGISLVGICPFAILFCENGARSNSQTHRAQKIAASPDRSPACIACAQSHRRCRADSFAQDHRGDARLGRDWPRPRRRAVDSSCMCGRVSVGE